MNKVNLGAAVKRVLDAQGKSQTDLAIALGKSPQYVSQLVTGKRGAQMKIWQRIADILGVTFAALASDDATVGVAAEISAVRRRLDQIDPPLAPPPAHEVEPGVAALFERERELSVTITDEERIALLGLGTGYVKTAEQALLILQAFRLGH